MKEICLKTVVLIFFVLLLINNTAFAGPCYDWGDDPANFEPYNYYVDYVLEYIEYGPYCADGRQWKISDVDNDGYSERYMLVGETYCAWGQCTAHESHGCWITDIKFNDQSAGCYDGSCNGTYEKQIRDFRLYQRGWRMGLPFPDQRRLGQVRYSRKGHYFSPGPMGRPLGPGHA